VNGHPAPAGADLEQVIGRLQLERAADPLEADVLGPLEALLTGLEVGARVHHRLAVEEELEHLVAEVVVGGDVRARAGARVEHLQRAEPLEGKQQGCDPAPERIGAADVAGGDSQQGRKVVGVPEPFGVALAEADALRRREPPVDPRVVDLDAGAARRRRRAELPLLTTGESLVELDRARFDPAQYRMDDPSPWVRAGLHHSRSVGGLKYGAPLSFSRAALK